MVGVKNALLFLNNNWVLIITIAGLLISLLAKIKEWKDLSTEEKVAIAKENLNSFILLEVSNAEVDWSEFQKAGSIKRAQVIQKIYKEFPILYEAMEYDKLMELIDSLINEVLDKTVRNTVRVSVQEFKETQEVKETSKEEKPEGKKEEKTEEVKEETKEGKN